MPVRGVKIDLTEVKAAVVTCLTSKAMALSELLNKSQMKMMKMKSQIMMMNWRMLTSSQEGLIETMMRLWRSIWKDQMHEVREMMRMMMRRATIMTELMARITIEV